MLATQTLSAQQDSTIQTHDLKQVTGMTPREFRELETRRRTALDAL